MIGLIIWLLLIFIIACCACPGFLTALLIVFSLIAACFIALRLLVRDSRKERDTAATQREKAIDEWERKWNRTHPSRINK